MRGIMPIDLLKGVIFHIKPCELPNAQEMPQEQGWGKSLKCLSIKNESWTTKFIIN